MSDGSGTTAWSYDANGNILTEKRTIAGITKTIYYAYNMDNSLKSLTYPSGRVVNYAVSNAQRTTSAIDGNGTQYAIAPSSGAMYAPPGGLASAVFGKSGTFGGITDSRTYNNRLQVATHHAGTTLSYTYGYGSPNNGEITSVATAVDSVRSQNFTYDALSRILTAVCRVSLSAECRTTRPGAARGNGVHYGDRGNSGLGRRETQKDARGDQENLWPK